MSWDGIIEIRNRATYLGILRGEASTQVLLFGAASVRNFVTLYHKWFQETIHIPYLLPIGFVGEANLIYHGYPKGQKDLIKTLAVISSNADHTDADHSVTLSIDVNINPVFTGGAVLGISDDPTVPKVQISDDEMLRNFPASYNEIVKECRIRYHDFKLNSRFRLVMKSIKLNAICAYERRLDPRGNKQGQWFYNRDETFRILDAEYKKPGRSK